MKEFLVYTAARLALFVGVYVVVVGVYLLVTGSSTIPLIWPFLIAVVGSSILSVYLLRGQRARFGAVIQRRADVASRRLEQARSKEDLPDDGTADDASPHDASLGDASQDEDSPPNGSGERP